MFIYRRVIKRKVYKYLNSTFNMTKEDLNNTEKGTDKKIKAKTVVVKGTITKNQKLVIKKLVGILGSNEQDVVGKILTLWLYNEGFLNIDQKQNKNKTKENMN
jgi:hypothetical protein